MKKYILQKICLGMSLAVSICINCCGSVAYAAEEQMAENTIRSCGKIVYSENKTEKCIYDSADIQAVLDCINRQKGVLIQKLLQLGTRFIRTENGWQYLRNPEITVEELPGGKELTWEQIFHAVKDSQTVPGDMVVKEPKIAVQIEGIDEVTDFYKAAAADNLSNGKAAWRDGILLLGTGADNEKAYAQGKEDGKKGSYRPDMIPIYAAEEKEVVIRHKHIGSSAETEGWSGCYHNFTTMEVSETVCGATLYQTETTWYPNESEEGGGSWHGGYYTCPWHGGIYETSGTCDSVDIQRTTVWHHDISCGKTDLVYAVLKITGTEEDYLDGKIHLCAELVEREGFANLRLSDEKFVWKNAQGEILGNGAEIIVEKPGLYSCSVVASNEDVNMLTGNTKVIIKGIGW